jgi:hypothetical protein
MGKPPNARLGDHSMVCLVVLLVAGCEPQMSVAPTPRVVCAGTTLSLEWHGRGDVVEVTGDPTHVICPNTPCAVEKQGTRQVAVNTLVALTFVARNGSDPVHSQTARWEAQPLHAKEASPRIASIDACDDSARIASGHFTITALDWQPSLLIDEVVLTAPLDRAVRVVHGSVSLDLAAQARPAQPSPFHGAPAIGDWTIQVPFAPGESCGHVQLPHGRVGVALTAQCGG